MIGGGITEYVVLLIYLFGMIGIGVYWAKHSTTSEDYLLGGRKIGSILTALTLQTTSMSGYMFMGGPAQAYREGYFTLWYAVGDGGGAIFNVGILGKRMRRLSYFLGCLSPIEYIEKRYPGPATRIIAAAIAICFVYGYVLAQFLSAGKTMCALLGVPLPVAIIIGAGVIVFYTFAGGYLAVAWTDFVQGIIMVCSMVLIFVLAWNQVGGLTGLNTALTEMDPTLTGMWGKDNMYMGQWGVVAGAVGVYLIGYMGLPHVVIRHMAMESPKLAKQTVVIATVWNQLFIFVPYIIGLMGILMLPELDPAKGGDPEMVVLTMAYQLLPGVLAAIVLVAIMSAIMSTADAQLMLMGTMLGRDIYQRYVNKNASDKQLMNVSRICILVVGVISVIIALIQPPGVFQLVVFSFSTLGSSFLPSYVGAVWWKRGNTTGCVASMISGCIISIVWEAAGLASVTGMHTFFIGIIISIAAYIIGSLIGKPPTKEMQDLIDRAACKTKIPAGFATVNYKDIAPETNGVLTFLKESNYMEERGFQPV
ncbi:MAG: sodium/proline symporter [Bacillota bacterium]|nr:sodium/proline symporter [Bacillota bacterium]